MSSGVSITVEFHHLNDLTVLSEARRLRFLNQELTTAFLFLRRSRRRCLVPKVTFIILLCSYSHLLGCKKGFFASCIHSYGQRVFSAIFIVTDFIIVYITIGRFVCFKIKILGDLLSTRCHFSDHLLLVIILCDGNLDDERVPEVLSQGFSLCMKCGNFGCFFIVGFKNGWHEIEFVSK